MKKLLLALSLVWLNISVWAQTVSPAKMYPGLFEAVQLSNIFPDSKTFVDALPKEDAAAIMQSYHSQKDRSGFDLKQFVTAHFILPQSGTAVFKTDISAGIRKHIDTLWQVLYRRHDIVSRSSLLPLPHGYIVPGGRFREIYYWDSYFTMLGLQESHKNQLIADMVENFAYLIDTYGFIPNGTRDYYLTRSQPPFFSLMVKLLTQDKGDNILVKYQPELLKEYAFWMDGAGQLNKGSAYRRVIRLQGGELLNRYWDDAGTPREEAYKQDVAAAKLTTEPPAVFYRNIGAAAESGWDFSSRWFGPSAKLTTIKTTDLAPVDLNCLLYHLEGTIARSYQLQGNTAKYKAFIQKARLRKAALLKYCWNENQGWFMDYNWRQNTVSPEKTLAGVFPLALQLANNAQAIKLSRSIRSQFLKPGGLVTTLRITGQQWDGPNGWAPLEYLTIDGLRKYHQTSLAKLIALRWINTNIRVFKQTGKLMEKYNVLDTHIKAGGGEYALQDGFGWTNGVLLRLMNLYGVE